MPTLQRVRESTLYPGLFIEYTEGAQALWLGGSHYVPLEVLRQELIQVRLYLKLNVISVIGRYKLLLSGYSLS